MKKILLYSFMLVLIISLGGCGAKGNLEGKAEEAVFGESEWPISDLGKGIPKFKGGKVVTVMEGNNTLIVALQEVSSEDFEDYLEEIEQTFTEEAYDVKSDECVIYAAKNGEGIDVMLMYTPDETLNITVTRVQK